MDVKYYGEDDGRGDSDDDCSHRGVYAHRVGPGVNEGDRQEVTRGFPAEQFVNDIGWARWKFGSRDVPHCRREDE